MELSLHSSRSDKRSESSSGIFFCSRNFSWSFPESNLHDYGRRENKQLLEVWIIESANQKAYFWNQNAFTASASRHVGLSFGFIESLSSSYILGSAGVQAVPSLHYLLKFRKQFQSSRLLHLYFAETDRTTCRINSILFE